MQAAPVKFHASDGTALRGHRYGLSGRWAILVHDEGEDLDVWRGLTAELVRAGFSVLAFDLRGHGFSDDPWDPADAPGDVVAALAFAEAHGANALCLVGAGAGATAALVAAGRHPVRALVALSPRARLNDLPADAVREARAPKLIIVGAADRRTAAEARELYQRSIGWALFESPPVEEQGAQLLASRWGNQVREHLLGFLADYA